MGRFVFLAWLLTGLLSYGLLGGLLAQLIEGYDRSRLPAWPWVLTALAVLCSCTLTGVWAWRGVGPSGARPAHRGRRIFVRGILVTAGGLFATLAGALGRLLPWYDPTIKEIFLVRPPYKAAQAEARWTGSRVSEYRRLGRTDARVSDISIGTGSSTGGRFSVPVAREAMERGINYVDTAPDYSQAGSETILGEAIQGVRDQMFIATKFCTPSGHLGPGASVAEYMEAVNGSLRRLRTDRVDLIHVHSCDSVERLLDPNAHEAFDRLKEQGKARFLGVSTHTPNLEAVANAAIESDRFDVMMLAYHFGAWPQLESIVERAAQKDIGVVAMKTLRGSMHEGLLASRPESDSFTQASFKWVLSNPSVSCLVVSLWESGQLDEFLYASGQRPRPEDLALLGEYDARIRGQHCRPHCGLCLSHCPEELPIDDILRYRMYFEQYGAQKEAMRLYQTLEKKADACAGCSAPCLDSCPEAIVIPRSLADAHRLLTLG